jgi:short-subunit dehydrogenase
MNIVITGASKGIGRSLAEIFASNGDHLMLCARRDDVLQQTVMEIKKKNPGASIQAQAADLSVKAEIEKFGNWILEKGVPDILINNAGKYLPGNTFNEEDGNLELQLDTNLLSAYYLVRKLVPAMIRSGKGHIFNICSVASLKAYPGGGSYSISKFALSGFTKNLREELKGFNIKVTAVYPGAVLTDSWNGFDNSGHRIMEAADISKMVFAASQLSLAACVEDIIIRPQLGDL